MSFGWVYSDLSTPEFSARECAKQLILLEDHMSCPGKECPDCISKHRLAAEAFADEALGLGARAPWLANLPQAIRAASGPQDYRAIRKDLTAHLREVGMAGFGFGRFGYVPGYQTPETKFQYPRAVGATLTAMTPEQVAAQTPVPRCPFSGFDIQLIEGLDPVAWLSSEPAMRLGLMALREGPHGPAGPITAYASWANPQTVLTLLKQDSRVLGASLIAQQNLDCSSRPAGWAEPIVVQETRPEPGKPEMHLPGYVPKDTSTGTAMTWEEKKAAEAPATGGVVAQAAAAAVPWWAWLLGAFFLLRQ